MLINTIPGHTPPNPGDAGSGPAILAASTVTGISVLNEHDEELGVIEEIMLDMHDGRIAYAVLSYGGLLGLGDKLFAIPWSALRLDSENECFILEGVSPERLQRAPGFDKQHWPSMADFSWVGENHN